jgi:uncharacterized protein (UPF0303 family)
MGIGGTIMPLKEDIERLLKQEQELRFRSFDEATAFEIGGRLRSLAIGRSLPIVIDIRQPGRPLFYCAMAGSSPDNPEWVRRKANVVMRYYCCSYRMSRELALKDSVLDEKRGVSPLDYAPHGGSFPIHVEGAGIIGTITVSGLPQRDDHNLVVEVLASHLGKPLAELALGPE